MHPQHGCGSSAYCGSTPCASESHLLKVVTIGQLSLASYQAMAHYCSRLAGPIALGVLGQEVMNVALMPVRLEDTWVALEASAVSEVLGPQTCLMVPRSSPHLPGVCAWRGRAIPVLELAALLGISRSDHATFERTLVVSHQQNTVAMPVAEARAVLFLPQSELRQVHATSVRFARAEVDWEQRVVAVLDLDALFGELVSGSESRGRFGVDA